MVFPLLRTLSHDDIRSGLGEVIKLHLVAGADAFTGLKDRLRNLPADPVELESVIEDTLIIKKAYIERDEYDQNIRNLLNYGHTFGHAVERREKYRWRHGAAVSVGMMFVAELAALGGRLPESDVDRHRVVLGALGLPTTYAAGHWDALLAAMAVDKKARGSLLRFVVLQGIGNPVIWEGPDPALLAAAYASISA